MLPSLPPARRRLVLAVVATALVGTLVAVLLVLTRGGDRPLVAAPQDRPGPVLLVPGYGGATPSLEALARRLRAAGKDAQVVHLPDNGTGDLYEQANVLNTAVHAALARTRAPSVDIVGYSAGGVVARLWAEDDGGGSLARRVVTLGSPHHGTGLAELAGSLLPSSCPTACQQLAPGSDLLDRLNAEETPAGPHWVSVWTTRDQVVTPPDSARLDGALNIPLQSVCARSVVEHSELPTSRLVQALVLAALGRAAPAQPTPADCRRLSS